MTRNLRCEGQPFWTLRGLFVQPAVIKWSEGRNFTGNDIIAIGKESTIALTQKPMDGGKEMRSS